MTWGHHTPAIIYSGKVIRELGPGKWCAGVGAHGGIEDEDGDGNDGLFASDSS